jgi:hypothetical protein
MDLWNTTSNFENEDGGKLLDKNTELLYKNLENKLSPENRFYKYVEFFKLKVLFLLISMYFFFFIELLILFLSKLKSSLRSSLIETLHVVYLS